LAVSFLTNQAYHPLHFAHIKLIKGSRKNRIARGSGTQPQDINKLIKQFEKMQKQMKKMSGGKMEPLINLMWVRSLGVIELMIATIFLVSTEPVI
jgi:signal recognition particle GTPase